MNLQVPKMLGNSRVAAQLAASLEEFSSMELVNYCLLVIFSLVYKTEQLRNMHIVNNTIISLSFSLIPDNHVTCGKKYIGVLSIFICSFCSENLFAVICI
jgi:hypothetical protein